MELVHFLEARQSWETYLNSRALFAHQADAGALHIRLSAADYQLALDAGLGAVRATNKITSNAANNAANNTANNIKDEADGVITLSLEQLARGLDYLNADFHILLGDLLWKHELESAALAAALQEVRVEEFESQARAFRQRAERAYVNCWHEEALADFREAAERNYPDFSVHRSIGSILLYHLVDLRGAYDAFAKAAKYAQPCDATQAAEANYFAAIVCALQQQFDESFERLQQSLLLNPHLYEAHYQKACLAAMVGETQVAVESLEAAIEGDARYCQRARLNGAFDGARGDVEALLAARLELARERFAALKEEAARLTPFVIARPEKRENLAALLVDIEARLEAAATYQATAQILENIALTQTELHSLYDLFFKKHEVESYDYIRALAFSPDGRLMATGFLYEGIKIWETDSALKVRALKGHTSRVNALAFSPNNGWLASGSRDHTVRLWDIDAGRELRALDQHQSEVRAVAFSPDGEWLASGGNDRRLRLWRAVTGNEVQVFRGHSHFVTSVAFSPDGKWLASASLDTRIKLWDVASGREVLTLAGHSKGIEAIAFSPDGRLLASGGGDRVVRVWDLESGSEHKRLLGHWGIVTSVAFSPDGDLVVAGSLGRTVRIWKLQTGREIKTLWHPDISYNPVAFSPQGHWLAFGNHQIHLWLKTVLTESQYEQVCAGEQRALLMKLMKQESEALSPTGIRWLDDERDEAVAASALAEARTKGRCRVCETPLTFFERLTRKRYCVLHR